MAAKGGHKIGSAFYSAKEYRIMAHGTDAERDAMENAKDGRDLKRAEYMARREQRKQDNLKAEQDFLAAGGYQVSTADIEGMAGHIERSGLQVYKSKTEGSVDLRYGGRYYRYDPGREEIRYRNSHGKMIWSDLGDLAADIFPDAVGNRRGAELLVHHLNRAGSARAIGVGGKRAFREQARRAAVGRAA